LFLQQLWTIVVPAALEQEGRDEDRSGGQGHPVL
jgi:hypothetical protein